MDVGELLTFQPDKPAIQANKRKKDPRAQWRDEVGLEVPQKKSLLEGSTNALHQPASISEEEKKKILKMVEDEPETEIVDETSIKKMILKFEKRSYKNQEMRIKYPDQPDKFLESEMELNDVILEMHVIATVPDLYHIVVELNAVQSLLQLLHHENTDIAIAVVDLLQEMTDVDTLNESEEGATSLIDVLCEQEVVALLIQNIERLDESIKEEADAVHNTLAIIENMTEFREEICVEAVQQGLMMWLLKRLKTKLQLDVTNKLYCSEILAILIQNNDENREKLGELDGIDVLLQQLAVYKKHDPASPEESEMMENLFNCLCSALMLVNNRQRFLKGEGLQLMNLMLREKKQSRNSAIKVLNHAMTGQDGIDNCQKFVDILGLRSIFPVFMKTPKRNKKGPSQNEMEEHVCSIISAMLRNCSGQQKQRLLNKFTENDHEKVDRLLELHFKYLEKVRKCDKNIEKEKNDLKFFGGEISDDLEDEFYLRRLDAGLFTLQLVDYIMMEVCTCNIPSIRQRGTQILNMRGGSVKAIKAIMREYAGNIGDAGDSKTQEAEQNRILNLVDKF